MTTVGHLLTRSRRCVGIALASLALLVAIVAPSTAVLAAGTSLPNAATQPPQGTWTTYGILSNTGVTNTGPSVVQGDLGSSGNSSATAVTGFQPSGPGTVTGKIVLGGAAITAQTDATAAVNGLESQVSTCTTLNGDLGGRTLAPGVYCFSAGLTGTLILNAGADPNAVFIFLTPNNLIVNPNATVVLIGSSSCNVYWRTNGLASLDTNVTFIGTIFASSQVTMNSGTKLTGRAIAQTANVTLINDSILSSCVAGATATPTGTVATPTGTVATPTSTVATPTGTPSTPTGTSTQTPTGSGAGTSPPSRCIGNIRGSKQDGNGSGLAGWTIQLIQNGQVIQTTVTDSAGNFSFLGLGLGTYTVQEVAQSGWTARGSSSFSESLTNCNQNLTGVTFVNVSGSGATTPIVIAISTPVGSATTPISAATAVATPVIPSSLPHTGENLPARGTDLLIFGAGAVVAGLLARRARQ